MNVLLLSAYAAGSHVHWQKSLESMFPAWQWQVLSLPPRYFSWRVRGNPLHWALQERETLIRNYDLLIATSMVDLATLRGLVPELAGTPSIVYFHENQFEYPQRDGQHSLLEAQMVSIYAALAADRIAFNSRYNQRSFLDGCAALMAKLPDFVPAGLADMLAEKSVVLPVPCDRPGGADQGSVWPWTDVQRPARPLRLSWLGRFEHDKGGEGLLRVLQQLEERDLDYELAVTGQQFRQSPPVFDLIQREFAHRLVQFGYVESVSAYGTLLAGADIVLSTSLHEFQGLGVLEAVASGCLPVVPDRLVYPEIYPSRCIYATAVDDPDAEAACATQLILQMAGQLRCGEARVPDVTSFSTASLAPRYARLLREVGAARHSQ